MTRTKQKPGKRKRGRKGQRDRKGPRARKVPTESSNVSPHANGHKQSQFSNPDPTASDDEFHPKPVHLRLRAAYEEALEERGIPSDAVIAKKLGVRRETICRWRRRNGALRQWLATSIGGDALEMRPFVDRRVTHLALQGSPEHIKLYYQFVVKFGMPIGDAGDVAAAGIQVIQNYLVPRPEMPVIGAPKGMPTPLQLPADIPTIKVR